MRARHREVVASLDGVAWMDLEVALHCLRADRECAGARWEDDARERLIDGLHHQQTGQCQDAGDRQATVPIPPGNGSPPPKTTRHANPEAALLAHPEELVKRLHPLSTMLYPVDCHR